MTTREILDEDRGAGDARETERAPSSWRSAPPAQSCAGALVMAACYASFGRDPQPLGSP